jgi:ABC-type sugar transport system ATPase subunit
MMAGALSRNAKVLILDEPTASLSEGETVILFQHLRRLSKDKIGIVFISHRLDDIEQVCDEVIIMRNGKIIKSLSRESFNREEIVSYMIGRSLTTRQKKSIPKISSHMIFSAERVMVHDPNDEARYRVENFSITAMKGEIVGLFGLVGAGRTEFARAVFGTWPGKVTGEFKIAGKKFVPNSPKHAVKNGIGFLTEDRKQTGIFTGLSLTWNLDSASLKLVSKLGFISEVPDKVRTRNLMEQLDVRAQSSDQNIETLSGGNQQKVLLGRWLATSPKLLLLDEPTAGVDVGAREEIYQRVEELAWSGCSILVISSDLDEISRLCNRTYVLSGGRLTGEFDHNVSRQDLMAAATKSLRVATN